MNNIQHRVIVFLERVKNVLISTRSNPIAYLYARFTLGRDSICDCCNKGTHWNGNVDICNTVVCDSCSCKLAKIRSNNLLTEKL